LISPPLCKGGRKPKQGGRDFYPNFSSALPGEIFFWQGGRKNKPGGRKNRPGETFFKPIFSSALPKFSSA